MMFEIIFAIAFLISVYMLHPDRLRRVKHRNSKFKEISKLDKELEKKSKEDSVSLETAPNEIQLTVELLRSISTDSDLNDWEYFIEKYDSGSSSRKRVRHKPSGLKCSIWSHAVYLNTGEKRSYSRDRQEVKFDKDDKYERFVYYEVHKIHERFKTHLDMKEKRQSLENLTEMVAKTVDKPKQKMLEHSKVKDPNVPRKKFEDKYALFDAMS